MPQPATSDPTRTKLLEAAGQVFAEHGFHSATVREICSRAGANVAAVNYYFGDKVELYEEVLRQAVLSVHDDAMREALNDMEPRHALRRVIRHIMGRLCSAHRTSWTMRIMAHEMAQPTPAFARVVDEIIAPTSTMLRRVIGRLLNLSPDHEKTRLCVHSVIGQVIHYAHARPVIERLWPELKMTDETMDHIAHHIADFSLAYLTSHRSSGRKSS
jgi:TetR/AcrR family transcriptional regulator, regulator of cefoperazone and chloramphenicol sensitivity